MYSDNLETFRRTRQQDFDNKRFVYHKTFTLYPEVDKHFFLETHGITPAADIYLNGEHVATREYQSGSYGGHIFDITSLLSTSSVDDSNALLIEVFPVHYKYDLAIGFID